MNKNNIPQIIAVEASAGSGKTFTLAKRYIELLLKSPDELETASVKNILAITFTNKATVEMKRRILEYLKKIALNAFNSDDERTAIFSGIKTEDNIQEKAFKIIEWIITNYNFFQIQTIDSFVNSVLTGSSFYLGFSSSFRIRDDHAEYIKYALDRMIDKASKDKRLADLFLSFLDYYLFIENRDGWFSKKDIFSMMNALYNIMSIYGGVFQNEFNGKDRIRVPKSKSHILKLISDLRDNAPDGTNKHFLNSINKFLSANDRAFKIKDLSDFFVREKYPANKGETIPKKIERDWNKLKREIDLLCKYASEDVFYAYLKIFSLLLLEMRGISSDEDVLFLPELNMYMRKLFECDMMPVSEFYWRLATKFFHYLIDEFQDTSGLQWLNIFPFVNETLSSMGTLFYVGDKKQAIYRFRGGDSALFDSVKNQLNFFESQTIRLTKNYRSRKEIVEFNNRIFSEENLSVFLDRLSAQDNIGLEFSEFQKLYLLKNFSNSAQIFLEEKDHGFVKLIVVDANSVDERSSIVKGELLSLIRDLLKRFEYKDIAILTRNNKDVKEITSWLIEESIPVESEKTLNMRYHPAVKELISFLKFLNAPTDNLSLASFLTGDIFLKVSGLTLDKIYRFIFDNKKSKSDEKDVYLYKRFKDSFEDIWDRLIADFFKNAGYIPVYELLVSVLKRYSVMQNFPQYQGFIMGLLEFIKEKEDDYSGIETFVSLFESINEKELYIQVVESNAINITTIHKAKGLEFGVVIIPFVEIDVGVGNGGDSGRRPYVAESFQSGEIKLIQLKKEYNKFSEELKNKYMFEYLKSLIDELNTLYVAFTRAVNELYLFMPKKAANKKNLACLLLSSEDYESGLKNSYKTSALRSNDKIAMLPISEYSNWISILKEDFTKALELSNRASIKRGKIMHRILSFIGNLDQEDKDTGLKRAKWAILYEFPEVVDKDEYIRKASDLVEESYLKRFFYCENAEVLREREFVDIDGNTKIIDRLIVYDNEVLIVDYKSSKSDSENYFKQVREYIGILKSVYQGREIKGFLLYIDTFTKEEIYG